MCASGGSGVLRIQHLSDGVGKGHLPAFAGVILNSGGRIVRAIIHDPYGDLSAHPEPAGYYGSPRDLDNEGHAGRYAPYGNAPHATVAFAGGIHSTWFAIIRNSTRHPTAADLRARFLPGDGR